MIPRYGRPPKTRQTYTLRPGVYAILPKGAHVLLTHQDAPTPEFQLPGGGVDRGESPLTALYREVFEETGWRIARPRKLGAFRRFAYMPEYDLWAEKLCTIYAAHPVRPHGPATEAGHIPVWMPTGLAAEKLGNSGDRAFMAGFLASYGGRLR